MKKIVTLLLTAALAVTAATTAFADTTITPSNGQMQVTYEVQPSYSVTIPASVTLDSSSKMSKATVEAKDVKVPNGQAVKVRVKPKDADEFKVTSKEGAELPYTVTMGKQNITKDEVVLEVASGNGTTDLTFAISGNVVHSGTYTGNVIFTVSVEK